MDINFVTDTLRKYTSKKDKDLNKLMKYSVAFRIEKILKNYILI